MPLELLFLMCHCLLGGNLMAFGAKKKQVHHTQLSDPSFLRSRWQKECSACMSVSACHLLPKKFQYIYYLRTCKRSISLLRNYNSYVISQVLIKQIVLEIAQHQQDLHAQKKETEKNVRHAPRQQG